MSTFDIYHEKQKRMFCAVHAINNLLQVDQNDERAASKDELDHIADQLKLEEKNLLYDGNHQETKQSLSLLDRLTNSYRTPIFGNYSFEVLEKALLRRKVQLSWWKESSETNDLGAEIDDVLENEFNIGFVINIVSKSYIPISFGSFGRHWFSLVKRPKTKSWIVIDSKSSQPLIIETRSDLLKYLQDIKSQGGYILYATQIQ